MNQEIKAEWIKRLRSGQIKQNRNGLMHASDGSMCAFGVLGEILSEKGLIKKTKAETAYAFDGAVAIPPRTLLAHSGGKAVKIINMNEMQSFNKIATYIEKNL